MPAVEFVRRFGHATLTPGDDVAAGAYGTWTLSYTIGDHGVDDLGTILVARRLASDWGIPQFDRPGEAEYTTVTTTGDAKLRAWFDANAYIRPWKAAVVIRVHDGALAPGDTVTVCFGDRAGGGPGSRAQSFPETTYEFRVAVDAFGTGQFVVVPEPPTVRIIGGAAVRLRVLAPSDTVAGEPFAVTVRAEDAYGNPSYAFAGPVRLTIGDAVVATTIFAPADRGARRVEDLIATQPGIVTVTAHGASADLAAASNLIRCHATPPATRLYWGDPHGQTEMAVGTGSVEEYFQFGRDSAGLDFLAHCANDFQIRAEDHAETNEIVRRYHAPGHFVTFAAYEWSGNTPAGGDHNVYFLHDDPPIHRSSHWQIDDRSDEATDRYPIARLHETYRGRDDVLVLPHIGGRRANLALVDPTLAPAIEIMSIHGLFWWFAEEALARGLRVAFIAGSDDHSGRPGASFPSSASIHFGLRGGLTAVQAAALTREAVWEAIRARRCYGTTGERIIVDVTSDGHPMGAEYRAAGPPHLAVTVHGTAPLERLDLYRGVERICRHPLGPIESGRRLSVVWSGARVKGRNRETVWDGQLTLDQGRITIVRQFAFDSPHEGVTDYDERRVRWRSSTCGDPDGVLLDLADAAGATLTFEAPPCRFTLPLADLGAEPRVIAAGGVEQQVEVGWAPTEDGPRSVTFTYVDEAIQPGINAYYIRLRQADGALAWSSPIYVLHSA